MRKAQQGTTISLAINTREKDDIQYAIEKVKKSEKVVKMEANLANQTLEPSNFFRVFATHTSPPLRPLHQWSTEKSNPRPYLKKPPPWRCWRRRTLYQQRLK